MKLLTAEIKKALPQVGAQEDKKPEDVPVIVKFFHPLSGWAWYVTEGREQDDGDWLFFGLVRGFENELGYFSLRELESVKLGKGSFGFGVERDLHFGSHTLAEVQEKRI